MVATDPASIYQVLIFSVTKPSFDVLVSTHNKYYVSKDTNQPTTSTTNSSTELIPPPTIHELTIKPLKGVVNKSKFNP